MVAKVEAHFTKSHLAQLATINDATQTNFYAQIKPTHI